MAANASRASTPRVPAARHRVVLDDYVFRDVSPAGRTRLLWVRTVGHTQAGARLRIDLRVTEVTDHQLRVGLDGRYRVTHAIVSESESDFSLDERGARGMDQALSRLPEQNARSCAERLINRQIRLYRAFLAEEM